MEISETHSILLLGIFIGVSSILLMYWITYIINPYLRNKETETPDNIPEPVKIEDDTIPQEAITLIKKFEGFRAVQYLDAGGKPTIGYGETATNLKSITESQATNLLEARLKELKEQIHKVVLVSLNENQLSAILSFCYNLGFGSFERSTLLKMINKKASNAALEVFFTQWNQVGGIRNEAIYNRRLKEYQLFVKESD